MPTLVSPIEGSQIVESKIYDSVGGTQTFSNPRVPIKVYAGRSLEVLVDNATRPRRVQDMKEGTAGRPARATVKLIDGKIDDVYPGTGKKTYQNERISVEFFESLEEMEQAYNEYKSKRINST